MKNSIIYIGLAIFCFISSFALYRTYTGTELVYVDVNKLIEGYGRTKIAKEEFDKKAKLMKANVDSLLGGWQKELKEYEIQRHRFSPKDLQFKQEMLADKQQQINNYQEAIQNQIEEENKKITQSVINEINVYVKNYGKVHNQTIIFGATGQGNIMYADENADLTQEILEGLNADYDKR